MPLQNDPDQNAEEIYESAKRSLLAHTIRSVENRFFKAGILLHVSVLYDKKTGVIFRNYPQKASVLRMYHYGAVPKTPYEGLLARIFLRKDANHHLARLSIAHELYHLLLALEEYKACEREKWNPDCDSDNEPRCNRFAQQIAIRHNEFLDNGGTKELQRFPAEACDLSRPINLGDVTNLPDSLRPLEDWEG